MSTFVKKLILIVRTSTETHSEANPSKRPLLQIVPSGGHTLDLEFSDITGNEFEQGYSGIYEWDLPKSDTYEHKELKPQIAWRSTDGWHPDFIVLLSVGEDDHIRVESGSASWSKMMDTKDVSKPDIHKL